ncbi:MAG: UDP-N-acetylmuramoyl-L-alanyl-D-glutamate--2,6-diaminopimelate ligase [Smithellaceae bacterium]
MELWRLLNDIGGIKAQADLAGDVTGICYAADQCGPGSLFVAIPGLVHDGHDFIDHAVAKGARFIVHQKAIATIPHVAAIQVSDSRRALGQLAKNYFGDPSRKLTLVGITGTSGKTTITYLLESILTQAGFRCGVIGTVNYRYAGKTFPAPNTTPESYDLQNILRQMADEGVTHVLAEVSSHALDLRRVDDCDFDLGIFTNLSAEHLDYHQDMEAYFLAKQRFFTELLPGSKKNRRLRAVVNTDDLWGLRLLNGIRPLALSYGIEGEGDVRVSDHQLSLSGIRADICVAGRVLSVQSKLIGRFNLSNILAAIGAAHLLGVSDAAIAAGIDQLACVPGRLEKVPDADVHVFVDYAHKPDALTQVLENLNRLKQARIITVFGCGGNRDRAKRPLMGEAATRLSDLTIVTSDNPRREDPLSIISEITAGIDSEKIRPWTAGAVGIDGNRHSYTVIPDRKTAIETAIAQAAYGDMVLIAGKGHEDYQILGTRKVPFDDRIAAAEALRLRRAKG